MNIANGRKNKTWIKRYAENGEKLRAYQRQWNANNKAKLKIYRESYLEKNPNYFKEYYNRVKKTRKK